MIRASVGPSPNTIWVAGSHNGQRRHSAASRAASASGDPAGAATGARLRRLGRAGENSFCIIASTRAGAVRINSGIAAASGRLRQYFIGISARMASGISRAGLKIELK